jgi:hypothetical protein
MHVVVGIRRPSSRNFLSYPNFHAFPFRPSVLATGKVNAKGKVVKVYKHADVKTLLVPLVRLNELGLVKLKTECQLGKPKQRA